MAIPGLSGAFAGMGGLAGGIMANSMLGSASRAANRLYSQGRDYTASQNAQQRSDFMPYMQAGTEGLNQYQNLLAQGNAATQPTLSNAFDYNQWQDPSTQYRIDQSNAAINASALAKGGVGGGLAKALAGNAQNMASQEYGNTYNRYLQQNQQDFGQQQQQYQNQTQNYQNQLAGYGNLMGQGMNAASTTGNLSSAFTGQYNNLLGAQAEMGYQSASDRAKALGGGLRSAFSGMSGLF